MSAPTVFIRSTLVNKWLERVAGDNYRGARRVYAWSFFSSVRASGAQAREMIGRMGYHRRDKDVEEIEQQLNEA